MSLKISDRQAAYIKGAIRILEKAAMKEVIRHAPITGPSAVTDFLRLKYGQFEREVFGVIFLNNNNQVIGIEEMFQGTTNVASVYPREVAKRSFELNASKVIFFHNHPSGNPRPSEPDKAITYKLQKALDLVGVEVLDHVIVTAAEEPLSMVEVGAM